MGDPPSASPGRRSGGASLPERPRSLFAPETDPRRNLREAVDRVLSDMFMAFLSLLLLPLILVPIFVALPDWALGLIEVGDGTIVAFFIVEYFAKLYLAQDRVAHAKEPWHLLDLAIVVLSIVSYLPIPFLALNGRYALLARLARLPRAFAVVGRTAGSRVQTHEGGRAESEETLEMNIRRVGLDLKDRHDHLTWEELATRLDDGEQEWLDVRGVTPEGIARLSRLLKVPEPHFKSRVVDEIYPHVVFVQQVSFLFVQSGVIKFPETPESFLTVERSGILTICRGPKIITISRGGLDLFEKLLSGQEGLPEGSSFVTKVLYGIQREILHEYNSIFTDIELEVVKVSGMPRSRLPRDFLERIYELNKEVTRVASNLLHFKQMLSVITTRKLPLEGFDERVQEDFQVLHDEAGFLGEVADDLGDRIGSIIELYMNQESFETNRILKILAVITSLAIIPSAVSGILGENLLDVPFPLVLWEVVTGMGLAMMFLLYSFVKLGWLKT